MKLPGFNFDAQNFLGKGIKILNLRVIYVTIPILVSLMKSRNTLPPCSKPDASAADGLTELSSTYPTIIVGVKLLEPFLEFVKCHATRRI